MLDTTGHRLGYNSKLLSKLLLLEYLPPRLHDKLVSYGFRLHFRISGLVKGRDWTIGTDARGGRPISSPRRGEWLQDGDRFHD